MELEENLMNEENKEINEVENQQILDGTEKIHADTEQNVSIFQLAHLFQINIAKKYLHIPSYFIIDILDLKILLGHLRLNDNENKAFILINSGKNLEGLFLYRVPGQKFLIYKAPGLLSDLLKQSDIDRLKDDDKNNRAFSNAILDIVQDIFSEEAEIFITEESILEGNVPENLDNENFLDQTYFHLIEIIKIFELYKDFLYKIDQLFTSLISFRLDNNKKIKINTINFHDLLCSLNNFFDKVDLTIKNFYEKESEETNNSYLTNKRKIDDNNPFYSSKRLKKTDNQYDIKTSVVKNYLKKLNLDKCLKNYLIYLDQSFPFPEDNSPCFVKNIDFFMHQQNIYDFLMPNIKNILFYRISFGENPEGYYQYVIKFKSRYEYNSFKKILNGLCNRDNQFQEKIFHLNADDSIYSLLITLKDLNKFFDFFDCNLKSRGIFYDNNIFGFLAVNYFIEELKDKSNARHEKIEEFTSQELIAAVQENLNPIENIKFLNLQNTENKLHDFISESKERKEFPLYVLSSEPYCLIVINLKDNYLVCFAIENNVKDFVESELKSHYLVPGFSCDFHITGIDNFLEELIDLFNESVAEEEQFNKVIFNRFINGFYRFLINSRGKQYKKEIIIKNSDIFHQELIDAFQGYSSVTNNYSIPENIRNKKRDEISLNNITVELKVSITPLLIKYMNEIFSCLNELNLIVLNREILINLSNLFNFVLSNYQFFLMILEGMPMLVEKILAKDNNPLPAPDVLEFSKKLSLFKNIACEINCDIQIEFIDLPFSYVCSYSEQEIKSFLEKNEWVKLKDKKDEYVENKKNFYLNKKEYQDMPEGIFTVFFDFYTLLHLCRKVINFEADLLADKNSKKETLDNSFLLAAAIDKIKKNNFEKISAYFMDFINQKLSGNSDGFLAWHQNYINYFLKNDELLFLLNEFDINEKNFDMFGKFLKINYYACRVILRLGVENNPQLLLENKLFFIHLGWNSYVKNISKLVLSNPSVYLKFMFNLKNLAQAEDLNIYLDEIQALELRETISEFFASHNISQEQLVLFVCSFNPENLVNVFVMIQKVITNFSDLFAILENVKQKGLIRLIRQINLLDYFEVNFTLSISETVKLMSLFTTIEKRFFYDKFIGKKAVFNEDDEDIIGSFVKNIDINQINYNRDLFLDEITEDEELLDELENASNLEELFGDEEDSGDELARELKILASNYSQSFDEKPLYGDTFDKLDAHLKALNEEERLVFLNKFQLELFTTSVKFFTKFINVIIQYISIPRGIFVGFLSGLVHENFAETIKCDDFAEVLNLISDEKKRFNCFFTHEFIFKISNIDIFSSPNLKRFDFFLRALYSFTKPYRWEIIQTIDLEEFFWDDFDVYDLSKIFSALSLDDALKYLDLVRIEEHLDSIKKYDAETGRVLAYYMLKFGKTSFEKIGSLLIKIDQKLEELFREFRSYLVEGKFKFSDILNYCINRKHACYELLKAQYRPQDFDDFKQCLVVFKHSQTIPEIEILEKLVEVTNFNNNDQTRLGELIPFIPDKIFDDLIFILNLKLNPYFEPSSQQDASIAQAQFQYAKSPLLFYTNPAYNLLQLPPAEGQKQQNEEQKQQNLEVWIESLFN